MKEDLIEIVGNLDNDDLRLLYIVALELKKITEATREPPQNSDP